MKKIFLILLLCLNSFVLIAQGKKWVVEGRFVHPAMAKSYNNESDCRAAIQFRSARNLSRESLILCYQYFDEHNGWGLLTSKGCFQDPYGCLETITGLSSNVSSLWNSCSCVEVDATESSNGNTGSKTYSDPRNEPVIQGTVQLVGGVVDAISGIGEYDKDSPEAKAAAAAATGEKQYNFRQIVTNTNGVQVPNMNKGEGNFKYFFNKYVGVFKGNKFSQKHWEGNLNPNSSDTIIIKKRMKDLHDLAKNLFTKLGLNPIEFKFLRDKNNNLIQGEGDAGIFQFDWENNYTSIKPIRIAINISYLAKQNAQEMMISTVAEEVYHYYQASEYNKYETYISKYKNSFLNYNKPKGGMVKKVQRKDLVDLNKKIEKIEKWSKSMKEENAKVLNENDERKAYLNNPNSKTYQIIQADRSQWINEQIHSKYTGMAHEEDAKAFASDILYVYQNRLSNINKLIRKDVTGDYPW
jgi:hypothetical protein